MPDQELVVIASAGVCAGFAVLSTLPSLARLARAKKSPGPIHLKDVYEDEDGVATEESEDDFSDVIPKWTFYLCAIAGFSTAVASAVLSTIWSSDLFQQRFLSVVDWLSVLIWILVSVQAVSMSFEKSTVTRFRIGVEAACSSFLLIIVLLVQNGLLANRIETTGSIEKVELLSKVHLSLGAGQLLFSIITFMACISLPRRPALFLENGLAVDGQYTTSFYGRFTFSWVRRLLELCAQKSLELTDLPRPDFETRAKNIQAAFNPKKRKGSLLKLLFFAHWPALLKQVVFTIGFSIFRFSPQLAMLNLLRILEARSKGETASFEAWVWAISLGVGLIIQALLENWMMWITMSELLIPIRSSLSALIFQKAMRRKDVKEAGNSDGDEKSPSSSKPSENGKSSTNGTTQVKDVENKPKNEMEDQKKAKQSTINLVSIDANRVSGFSQMIRYFPDSVFMVGISVTFLLTLIGWFPLLCGILSFACIFPLNYMVSVRFRKLQKLLMQARDAKTAAITECLQGMRQIKFSALEAQWEARIGKVRAKELALQWKLYITKTLLVMGWFTGPVALSSVSLSVYAYLNGSLSPSTAFTTIGVFRSAQMAFTALPQVTTMMIEATVSLKRIQRYVYGPEQVDHLTPGDEISFKNADVTWPSDQENTDTEQTRFVLRNVNVAFPKGKLSIISGKTGCGKSLLLSSVLGESDLVSDGTITVPRPIPIDQRFDSKATAENWILESSIAYVAQINWIENTTVRDNVIFNLPFDSVRYAKTLDACALTKDLEMLTDGDMTEIGANGINISGGQRWRVTLARALYSRAGTLVLDDILSAVDAHVGRWILDNALTGELGQGRTRILATHHIGLALPKASYAVQLGEGTIVQAGTIEELRKSGAIDEILQEEGAEPKLEEEIIDEPTELDLVKTKSIKKDSDLKPTPKKFVEDEHRAKGKIKTAIYMQYFKVSGSLFWWGLGLLLFIVASAIQLLRSWWVKVWTDSYQEKATFQVFGISRVGDQTAFMPLQNATTFSKMESSDLGYYLKIYFVLGLTECILASARELYVYSLGWRGSRTLFKKMMFTVLRAPLRWIDTMPLGRILNRFTADFSTIDGSIAPDLENTIECIISVIAIMVGCVFASPIIIVFGLVLVIVAVYYARFYLGGARETKRLDSTTRSPIYEQLGSALIGVGTIRAFDNTALYMQRIYDKLDNNIATSWNLFLCTRWLSFRLAMIGAGFTFSVALLIVGISSIDAALAGFALSFSLEFSKNITWALRFYTSCELDMNAAERVIEYCDLKTEPLDGADAPAAWPTEGSLEVDNLEVGYAPDLPPVLKGLSFRIEGGQRIGIVGRTGAGKSSLAMALFRFLEARSGKISIDGIDISTLKLFDLRSRLAIIPQDPTIFSGTVRSNLDPFDQCTDAELKEALQRVHLVSTPSSRDESITTSSTSTTIIDPDPNPSPNTNPFTSLSSPISFSGLNLSQGQRQLLCLARAILSHSKLMILDEATSSVDMATDVLIQRSIREEFEGSTLLVIAHRLSTIADFDRILVMGEGRVVEFGKPRELLGLRGAFWEMVRESGDRVVLEGLIMGGAGS